MTDYDALEQALRDSRSKTNMLHGPGAWDVADVMAVVKPFVERQIRAVIWQENTASGQPKWRTDQRCVYCDGTGIYGAKTSTDAVCPICDGTGSPT